MLFFKFYFFMSIKWIILAQIVLINGKDRLPKRNWAASLQNTLTKSIDLIRITILFCWNNEISCRKCCSFEQDGNAL